MNEQEKIISEAANWAIRVDVGLTAADQDAFLDWFTTDPRHAEAYDRQRAHWARLDILADWRPEHAVRPNRDLLAPGKASIFDWLKKRYRVLSGAGFGIAAAAAACAAAVVFVAPKTANTNVAKNGAAQAQFESGMISSIEQSKLDDGTIVELNRGASITVMYTPTERYVKLNHGEVNFQVAKDPARPFIVNVDGVNVRALGTSFNVRRNNGDVEVLVTSGVVQVHAENEGRPASVVSKSAQEDAFVKAGQMAVVSLAAQTSPSLSVQTVALDKIENMIAWHPRLLDITEQPLSSAVEEFNRRNAPIRLIIGDPELEKTEVSATMRSDQVENFVRLLEGDFRMKAERAGNLVTLYKKRRG